MVRGVPGDGEPWLPPGDNARPEGGARVLERMAGRVALFLGAAVVCVGAVAAGVDRFVAEEDRAAAAHQRDLTVYGNVVEGYDTYFVLDYPEPGGQYRVALYQRKGDIHLVGDRVQVTYSPDAPDVVWIPGDDLLDPTGEWVADGLTLAGMVGALTAIGFAGLWWRRRRAVRQTGWRAAKFDFGEPGVARATFTDGTRLRLRPVRGLSRTYARFGTGKHRGFLAGAGTRMVLLVPGADGVVVQAVSTRWR